EHQVEESRRRGWADPRVGRASSPPSRPAGSRGRMAFFHGCYKLRNGALRLIDPASEQCTTDVLEGSWNKKRRPGDVGPAAPGGAGGPGGGGGGGGAGGPGGRGGGAGGGGAGGPRGPAGAAGAPARRGAGGPGGPGGPPAGARRPRR